MAQSQVESPAKASTRPAPGSAATSSGLPSGVTANGLAAGLSARNKLAPSRPGSRSQIARFLSLGPEPHDRDVAEPPVGQHLQADVAAGRLNVQLLANRLVEILPIEFVELADFQRQNVAQARCPDIRRSKSCGTRRA